MNKILKSLFLILCLSVSVIAEPLTLPLDQRPRWVSQDGIVMAGSWEPLMFRVRRDGTGYAPTDQQRAAYQREHSSEMVTSLKNLGVNFVMMHCYKGGGLETERESMNDAARFTRLCHDAGLHIGVYNYSGAFIWELFFKEMPQARDWLLLDQKGSPIPYGRATYRYYWNRNHPQAQAFYKEIIKFAVQDISADLIHFDNYHIGPGCDDNSVQRFRQYLTHTFTTKCLRAMGISDLDEVKPPLSGPTDNLLRRAWLDFSCKSLADSYHQMAQYARTLRPDILVECNPHGLKSHIRPPIDHGRILTGGEAFWDESHCSGYTNGKLQTRIRTYKIARRMNNMAFAYTLTPLEMAESMAFNLDCLGCICWFEYGKIVNRPGQQDPVSPALTPFIKFFHSRRDLLRSADVIADTAVLRSFPSQVFADKKFNRLTYQTEQTLIDNNFCFQIIYDQLLSDLQRYQILILAGCPALSDQQIEWIKDFHRSGGRLCIVGPAATHDEWMLPRAEPALAQLQDSRVMRIQAEEDLSSALHSTWPDLRSLSLRPIPGLCTELTRQPNRYLLHLVNYRTDQLALNIPVSLRIPAQDKVNNISLAGPDRQDDLPLNFEVKDGKVNFTVPEIKTYEIAVITLRK